MEAMAFKLDFQHELVRDFLSVRIAMLVKLAAYSQSAGRSCGCYQADDHCQAHERLAAPVCADVGEQTVLDFVPLNGPRGEMAHRDR